MKRIITYCYFLILFTTVTVLDLVPDHRIGYYTDYDLLLHWEIFPLLFFCHGIVSRLLTKPLKVYYPLILTTLFLIVSNLLSTVNLSFYLKSIILRVLCYTALTYVGILLSLVVEWIVNEFKKINEHHRSK